MGHLKTLVAQNLIGSILNLDKKIVQTVFKIAHRKTVYFDLTIGITALKQSERHLYI